MAYNHVKDRFPPIVNPWNLSPSEAEALRLLADGKDQHLAGFLMDTSHKSVSTFLSRAKEKLNAETTTHAVVIWDRYLREGVKCT